MEREWCKLYIEACRVPHHADHYHEFDRKRHPITVPTTFTSYNVLNMAPVEVATHLNYTYTFDPKTISGASENAPVQIGHFYALVNSEPQVLKLHYNGALGNTEEPISNVPLAPNTHVVLKGDVANAGLVSGTITATVVNDWTDSNHNFSN